MFERVRAGLGAGEGAGWLGVAWVLRRLVPFPRLWREVPPGTVVELSPDATRTVERVRSSIEVIATRLPRPVNCLTKALAGALMCRARGLRVPIALGVSARGGFAAHARLESRDEADLALPAADGRTHLGRLTLTF